jgi:hypothetical protein
MIGIERFCTTESIRARIQVLLSEEELPKLTAYMP